MTRRRTIPDARCPIRPGDACTLCHPGASGPHNCGLVFLVMEDDDLRTRLHHLRHGEGQRDDTAGQPH